MSNIQTPQISQYIQFENLIRNVYNIHQRSSLNKIKDATENERLYMCEFINAPIPLSQEHQNNGFVGTFTIMGSLSNITHNREKYSVNMYNKICQPTFSCSCKDYYINCTRLNRVCKHICFVVCKFGKIYNPAFFNFALKQLPDLDYQSLFQSSQRLANITVLNNANDISNNLIVSFVENDRDLRECFQATASQRRNIHYNHSITSSAITTTIDFKDLSAHKDWTNEENCPICFDIIEKDINKTVACPVCHNVIHSECIKVWLERKKTCVFCRDPIWKLYK